MWNTFLGRHIKPLSAEVVLALIPSRLCSYQFHNRLDNLILCNTRTVTLKLVAVKKIGAHDLLDCILCQLFVTHICYLLCIYSSVLFVIICSVFYSLFDYLLHFHWVLVLIVVRKEKEQFWPWTLFRYFDPVVQEVPVTRVQHHHHLESINIIQQTPPTLS